MLFKRLLALCLLVPILSACQTPPPKELPDFDILTAAQVAGGAAQERLASRQAILKGVGHWQVSGELSVKVDGRLTTMQLVWNQRGKVSVLDFSGPVGVDGANIRIAPGASVLTESDGRTTKTSTPEQLIKRVIGSPLPASLLRWWLVGLIDQGQLLSIDPEGRPEQFQVAEWTVSYLDFVDVEDLQLPSSVFISDGQLELKLSRARWVLRPEPVAEIVQAPAPKELPEIYIVPKTLVTGDTAQQRYDSRQAILKDLGYWQMSGKLSVKGNERPTSAQLVWNQLGKVSALDLSGPVGIGSVSLEIAPGASILKRGNGKTIKARTPEELIERVIGWPMPASLLRWWIVGAADQGQLLSMDTEGRPEQFQYAEWNVSYLDYVELEGLPLPSSVLITDGHLQLKLTRARWRLQPEPASEITRRVSIPGIDD